MKSSLTVSVDTEILRKVRKLHNFNISAFVEKNLRNELKRRGEWK